MASEPVEKKFEKMSALSHSTRVLKFTIISNGWRSVKTSFAEFISKFGNTNAIILLFSSTSELLKRSCAFEANSKMVMSFLLKLLSMPPKFKTLSTF